MQFITMVDKLQTALKVAGHKNSVSLHQSPPFSIHSVTFMYLVSIKTSTKKKQTKAYLFGQPNDFLG